MRRGGDHYETSLYKEAIRYASIHVIADGWCASAV